MVSILDNPATTWKFTSNSAKNEKQKVVKMTVERKHLRRLLKESQETLLKQKIKFETLAEKLLAVCDAVVNKEKCIEIANAFFTLAQTMEISHDLLDKIIEQI